MIGRTRGSVGDFQHSLMHYVLVPLSNLTSARGPPAEESVQGALVSNFEQNEKYICFAEFPTNAPTLSSDNGYSLKVSE